MRTLTALALVALTANSTGAAETSTNTTSVDYELRVNDRPILQRGFLPDCSARSIAVGLPGGLSYCFDAETCRLRYAWSGGFLDMEPTWHGRGAAPPALRGDRFFVAPDLLPLRIGEGAAATKVRFLGYALVNHLPEFRFTLDGVLVRERIEAAHGGGLRCVFHLDEAPDSILFHAPKGVQVSTTERALASDPEGWVKIPRGSPLRFEVAIPGPIKAAALRTNER